MTVPPPDRFGRLQPSKTAPKLPEHKPQAKMGFVRWVSGLVSNPATGLISHTKLWANIAAGVMTWKFMQMPEPPEWLWLVYGGSVGGYALIKRGMAVVPQLAEINKKGQNHAADFE